MIPSQVCPSFMSEYCQVDHTIKVKLYQSSKLDNIPQKHIRTEKKTTH
jgi:hypothetical protein